MNPDPAILAFTAHSPDDERLAQHVVTLCTEARAIIDEDLTRAHRLATEALTIARALGAPDPLRRALLQHGATSLRSGDAERALDSLRGGLDLARACGDVDGQLRALVNIGVAACKLGRYGEALEVTHEGLRVAREAGDRQREFNLLLNIGVMYTEVADYGAALETYEDAQELGATLDDPVGHAIVLNNVADVRFEMGDVAAAHDVYLRVIDVYREGGDRYAEATTLASLGQTSLRLERYAEARAWYEDALVLSRSLPDTYVECRALQGLADVARATRDHERALACCEEAMSLAARHGYLQNQILLLHSLADIFAADRDLVSAREMLERALDLALGAHLPRETYELHERLAQVCADQGDFERAYAYHRAFHAGEVEVRGQQAERRVATLIVRLDVQRARQDAEIERLRNVELAEANAALSRANAENAVLLDLLREQAQRDALTNLFNRRVLGERLHEEARRSALEGRPLGVILLDVDHFKRVNDTYSHAVGDAVLARVADLLRGACRESDTVARYGGEEFALLLPDTDTDGARLVAERLRALVERHDWERFGTGLRVTISVGVHAEIGSREPERMLAAADARLYTAKARGRNRVVS